MRLDQMSITGSLDLMRKYPPWPREENDKELIAELEERGYAVIPVEDLLDFVVKSFRNYPEED